jgi:entry exclusion lipoprotein TrbK
VNVKILCSFCSTAVIAAAIAGCSDADIEVNNENCKLERISAMKIPLEKKQEFGSKCARRGSFTSSEKKAY